MKQKLLLHTFAIVILLLSLSLSDAVIQEKGFGPAPNSSNFVQKRMKRQFGGVIAITGVPGSGADRQRISASIAIAAMAVFFMRSML